MLVPAILYKEQIAKEFQKHFYSNDMFFETGGLCNWTPEIAESPDFSTRQYAIVDKENKLIGYLGYKINHYSSCVYNFGLFSFDRGNQIIGRDLFNHMNELVQKYHRVEWRMVGGNPVERHYDKFCEKHNGTKHILKDAVKDEEGNYRDDIIYEIVNDKKVEIGTYSPMIEEKNLYIEKHCKSHIGSCEKCPISHLPNHRLGYCYGNLCTDKEIIMNYKAIKESEMEK